MRSAVAAALRLNSEQNKGGGAQAIREHSEAMAGWLADRRTAEPAAVVAAVSAGGVADLGQLSHRPSGPVLVGCGAAAADLGQLVAQLAATPLAQRHKLGQEKTNRVQRRH